MLIPHDNIELYKPFQMFTPEDCRRIIEDASTNFKEVDSLTVGKKKVPRRTSTTFWYNPTEFAFDDLMQYFEPFVEQDYLVNFVQRPIQVAKYEPGQFFGWHFDQFRGKRRQGRLLTLTCTLQEAPGADIEVEGHSFTLKTGEAVIFPANILHRATAPTEGIRWAFTTWGSGKITKISKRKDPRALG
jgi:hypothetical protein